MSDNIIAITKVNNNHLTKVIEFLEPFAKADMRSFELVSLVFTIPHQILYEDGVGNLHGFIAGVIHAHIDRYRKDLIAINKGDIPMNSLCSEAFKGFVEDISDTKGLATLTIPFKDVTITVNFIKFSGRWMIINMWENEVNTLQRGIERYIEKREITSDILFHTNME